MAGCVKEKPKILMNEKRGCGQENESEIKSEKIAKNSEKRNSEATQAVPSLLYLYFRQRNIPDSFGRCRTPFTISFSRIRFTVSRSDSTSKEVLLGSELR